MIHNIVDLDLLAGQDEYGEYIYEVWFNDEKVKFLEECDPEEGWIRVRIKKYRFSASDEYYVSSKKWGKVVIVKVYK